jgi:hypothetical protein
MKILIESQNDLEISPVSCVSSIKNGSTDYRTESF